MEGRGPYRIYDPGGGTEENGSAAFERLMEENARLKEKMQGIKSIGNSIGNCWWTRFGCRAAPASQPAPLPWLFKKGAQSQGFNTRACRGAGTFAELLGHFAAGCRAPTAGMCRCWNAPAQRCHPLSPPQPPSPTPGFAFGVMTQLPLSSPASAAEFPPPS